MGVGRAGRHRQLALAAWLAVVGTWAAPLFAGLGDGHLGHWDSFITAERTREALVIGDYTAVYINFGPSHAKPPLQYFQTVPLLALLDDVELAVRVWPALYGLGCFVLLGLIARSLFADDPWVVPTSAAFLAISYAFWFGAAHALLDTGATFYLLLTVLGCERASRDPRGWWLASLGIGLGGLQKFGLGLYYLVVYVLVRSARREDRSAFWNREVLHRGTLAPLLVAVALTFGWAILQRVLHGSSVGVGSPAQIPGVLQAVDPTRLAEAVQLYGDALRGRWGGVGFASLAALPGCLLFRGARSRPTLVATCLFCVAFLATLPAVYRLSPRYLANVAPLMALALASALVFASRRRALLVGVLSAALLAGSLASLRRIATFSYPDRTERIELARAFGETLREDEAPVHVMPAERSDFFLALLLFYGDVDRAVSTVSLHGQRYHPSPPVPGDRKIRGIAASADLQALAPFFPGLRIETSRDGFAMFTADRFRRHGADGRGAAILSESSEHEP